MLGCCGALELSSSTYKVSCDFPLQWHLMNALYNMSHSQCNVSSNAEHLHACRKLFALTMNDTSGEWVNEQLCLGGDLQCHSGLVGSRLGFITSLAEDEDGGWLRMHVVVAVRGVHVYTHTCSFTL